MSRDLPLWAAHLRPWLILGRVSNLPTVWSNVLAGWLLGGGERLGALVLVLAGTSCIYVAGMFLNDVVDVEFDREHRQERPIASGQVSWLAVLLVAMGLMAAGVVLVGLGGVPAFVFGLLLVLAVVVYDLVHKLVSFAPVVMALCRYLLVLVAGAAGAEGVTGLVVWSALALGLYVLGLSYVARGESRGGGFPLWPIPGLAVPLLLAVLVNPPSIWFFPAVLLPLALLVVWLVRCLRPLVRPGPEGPRRAVSGLLAGIVLVDLVATIPFGWPWGWVFLAFFAGALMLQRSVPAT